MSAINGLGNNSALFTVSRQNPNAVSTDSTSSGGSTTYVSSSAAVGSPSDGGGGTQLVSQGGGHHHHHHGNQQLFEKIKSAVTSALQSSSSNGASDPNKAVEDAIAQVLKENGVGGATAGGTPAAGSAPGNEASSGGASGAANGSDSRQAFSQLLQSYGIDSDQFRNDLRTAFQNAKQGDADPGAALQSIPAGAVFSTET